MKTLLRVLRNHLPDRRLYIALTIAVPVLMTLAAGYFSFTLSLERGLKDLQADETQLLSFHVWRLNDEINQFGLLPLAAAKNQRVKDFFLHPEKHDYRKISRYLATLNSSVGAMHTFLIDPDGRISASSNWNTPGSFVGRNVSYRPYFQNANPNHAYRFSAIGTTDTVPGYYLSAEVVDDGHRIGVAAIKIGLEQLRRHSLDAGRPLLVTDDNSVVVLSSFKDWAYRTFMREGAPDPIEKMSSEVRKLRYGGNALKPLYWHTRPGSPAGFDLVDIGDSHGKYPYLMLRQNVPEIGLNLIMLADSAAAYKLASANSAVAMALVALISLLCLIFFLRRRVVREKILHQRDLEAAYSDLEVLVEKRSQELKIANQDLRREISERTQAVEQLKAYQEELVRTENLTVIGQLSAGLAHEMNQPLGALGMLSDNTVRFLEKQSYDMVRSNILRIRELVERLGDIVHQLRSFARQSGGEVETVDVGASIEASQLMLAHRIKQMRIHLKIESSEKVAQVRCNKTRLEQVLVNLISNAMDATQDTEAPEITIRWRAKNGRVQISVSDNGPGFDESVQARLFEPFFTTKKTTGLGLGLAISADIIRSFGGVLSGTATPGKGATFTIILPDATQDEAKT